MILDIECYGGPRNPSEQLDAAVEKAEALKTEGGVAAASRWHRIEDGLPTESGDYLVTTVTREVRLAWFAKGGYGFRDLAVIAWQPKPAPYTGEDAEERQDEH